MKVKIAAILSSFFVLLSVKGIATVYFYRNGHVKVLDVEEIPVSVNSVEGKVFVARVKGSLEEALRVLLGKEALITAGKNSAVGSIVNWGSFIRGDVSFAAGVALKERYWSHVFVVKFKNLTVEKFKKILEGETNAQFSDTPSCSGAYNFVIEAGGEKMVVAFFPRFYAAKVSFESQRSNLRDYLNTGSSTFLSRDGRCIFSLVPVEGGGGACVTVCR